MHTLAAAHGLDGLLERFLADTMTPEQFADLALILRQREKKEFGCDELVAALLGFLVGHVQKIAQLTGHTDLAPLTLHLRQTANRRTQSILQGRHIGAGAREQRGCSAVVLLQQCQKKVLRFDIRVVLTYRRALGIGERLLEPGREFVETHRVSLDLGRSDWLPPRLGDFRWISTRSGRFGRARIGIAVRPENWQI